VTEVALVVLAGVPILVAVVLAAVEVVTRPDLGTLSRVAWLVALVALPVVGVAVYAVVRPLRRSTAATHDANGSDDAERLVVAAERRQRGEIDDVEFRSVVAQIAP
jgi:uncharacterized membrane protein